MAQNEVYNINKTFPIYKANGDSFYGLVIKKATVESIVMSLGDKISGDVYYPNNGLQFTMQEYVEYEGVRYYLVSPPTIVREGLVKDNSGLNGMTKYSLVFYHPMYMLGNFPFTDKAVTDDEENYLSQNKTFSWIGNLFDFVDKLRVNLENTEWFVVANISQEDEVQYQKAMKLSEVLSFDKNFISDALKTAYETWEIPFTITSIDEDETIEGQVVHKSFLIEFGLPSQEILDGEGQPYIFKFGQGVGLKNNSRTPKNNKIVTRIVGTGSERNIPFGYPQIRWWGDQSWEWTEYVNNDPTQQPTSTAYPIYKGIVGGQYVKLIKHPFTRKTLMPSVYVQSVFNKVSPYSERTLPDGAIVPNQNYNRQGEIIDFYDAVDTQEVQYPNPINPNAPSVEVHQFEEIYPKLGDNYSLVGVVPYNEPEKDLYIGGNVVTEMSQAQFVVILNNCIARAKNQNEVTALTLLKDFIQNTPKGATSYHANNNGGSYTYDCTATKMYDKYGLPMWKTVYTSDNINFNIDALLYEPQPEWIDTMDENGEYVQKYFKITLPTLDFDLYACASITEEMKINMRSGACLGCTFNIEVDWDDYKKNFYDKDGNFVPNGSQRNLNKYPKTDDGKVTLIVLKDLETFGTLMPNVYQYPKSGDKFVILGISLPTSYIRDAQVELDEAMKEYMLENNIHYFDYPLKFDEYFLTTHQDILAQIKNNNIVRFQYIRENMALYIKQITIKYGEGVLPQWDITLTDDVEIVLSKIGQVTDDVSRMRVQLSELQKYYSENFITLIEEKLSKVSDDVAQGRITFQQGLDAIGKVFLSDEIRSNDFSSGLGGRGWRIDQLGNAEVESLKVRSYLEVIELLINRIQAQEGDTLFTDNDQIDKVERVTNGNEVSYILSLKEKYEGYFTSQMYGNILKGVINTLAAKEAGVSDESDSAVEVDGSNSYYTSWMRVVGTTNTENALGKNQIRVVLYGDEDVPAEKNFEPCELMAIARWGCINYPSTATQEGQNIFAKFAEDEGARIGGIATEEAIKASIERRQRLFYISNTDGRLVKLRNVFQPKLIDTNYGTTLGILPNFITDDPQSSISQRLIKGRDYLYAQGVVVGDFIKVDINNDPLINIVDCGEWVNGGAQGVEPTVGHGIYLHDSYNEINLQWETHDVWHNGFRWRCLQNQPVVDGEQRTYYEPKFGSSYWAAIEGDKSYTMEFVSSNGYSFRIGQIDTTITAHLFYGGMDITNENAVTFIGWTRSTEARWQTEERYWPADEAWNAQHNVSSNHNYNPQILHLSYANNDMPEDWSPNNKAIFELTVEVHDGSETVLVQNHIIS